MSLRLLVVILCLGCAARPPDNTKSVRAALEKQYSKQRQAYFDQNPDAIRGVRAPEFAAQTPDGRLGTPEDAEGYLNASFQQVKRTLRLSFEIQSLVVHGDTAQAIIHQQWEREQDKAGALRVVETEAFQREWWRNTPNGWKLFFIDDIKRGVWKVDGKRVNPNLPPDPNAPPYEPTAADTIKTVPEPQGLARTALDNKSFEWIKRDAPHLRFYFAAGSFPAARQDELIHRAVAARHDILRRLGVVQFDPPVDVFFIESREQMKALTGLGVTGLAGRDERAVFLVNNAEWRSFEHHELMHVYAHHIWGEASGAWVEEGLAQWSDGVCGSYNNHDVVHALAEPNGYVPMDTLVSRFRELDDLTAYLEAASMMGYIYESKGRVAAQAVWLRGTDALQAVTGDAPEAFAKSWWRWVSAKARSVPKADLDIIVKKGCG